MIVNSTIIRQTISRFKPGLILNPIVIFHQMAPFPRIHFKDMALSSKELFLRIMAPGVNPLPATDQIHNVLLILLIENSKLSYLLICLAIIVLLVFLLERTNRKKKYKFPEAAGGKDGYFIEKTVTENDRTSRFAIDKEIMSCEVKEEILKKLLLFEEGTKYTDKNFNLSALSVKLKTNTKYLSYIINKYKKKDFNTYINELRIFYILKKMQSNPAYLNYKISYLAEECGFSSHSKFTAVFKSVVGMSPSHFMDMLGKKPK